MYYTSGCLKEKCKSITLLYDMKYQRCDILKTKNNHRLLVLDCFIDNDNQNKFYEVKEIWNKWKTIRSINIDLIESDDIELDKTYLRNKKLTKIINRINESINRM